MVEKKEVAFLDKFYGIKPTSKDYVMFASYNEAFKLSQNGISISLISDNLQVSKNTVSRWLRGDNIPFIAMLYNHYLKIGSPINGMKWISLNVTRGGKFLGQWICFPHTVTCFDDVKSVVDQLVHLSEIHKLIDYFELDTNKLSELKYYFFFYLLGMLLGDGAMCRGNSRRFVTRRMTLGLSQRFMTNERIGRYVVLCYNSLGLRMNRTKDGAPTHLNKHNFYRWQGQCFSLIQWINDVCFGLKDDEVKTYSPVKSDWLITCPKELKIAFLQGVADSDGYVDIGVLQVGLISKSNIQFFEKIFYREL